MLHGRARLPRQSVQPDADRARGEHAEPWGESNSQAFTISRHVENLTRMRYTKAKATFSIRRHVENLTMMRYLGTPGLGRRFLTDHTIAGGHLRLAVLHERDAGRVAPHAAVVHRARVRHVHHGEADV